jgi:hypothetical protein
MALGRDQARAAADLRKLASRSDSAVCLSLDWTNSLAVVSVRGAQVSYPWVGTPPSPGDPVRVLTLGGQPFVAAALGSPIGTVVSVTSTTATVLGDDSVQYTYPIAVGLTISAGHRVRLDHVARQVSTRYAAEPPGSTFQNTIAPPSPGPNAQTFHPIDSGNFTNGSFASQFVEVSSSRVALYWYGLQIANTIPDTATITKAVLRLSELWDELPSVASRLGTHTQESRGAAPTIAGSINVFDGGEVDISAFANALKTGAALGVGFQKNTGWRRFGAYDTSGDIYMEWI